MGLGQRLRDLDAGDPSKRETERSAVLVAAAFLGLAVVLMVGEVFGGPYGIPIFGAAMVGGIDAGRVIEARAARRGQGLRP